MDLNQILELQKKRMSIGSNSLVDDIASVIFSDFEKNPAYRVVEFEGQDVGVHFIDNGTGQGMPSRYAICKPPFEFSVGDIIKTTGDELWICTVVNSVQYNKSFFIPCNLKLKFINSDNELIEKDCRVSGQTLYTTGIKDEKVIEIPNGMMGIQVPFDDDTKKLDRKQGFIFNKTKYELTFYNDIEHLGLIVLICTEVPLSANDDKVNKIADRWINVQGGGRVDRLPWLDEQEPPTEPELPVEPVEPIEGLNYKLLVAESEYEDDVDGEIYWNSWCKYRAIKLVGEVEIVDNFTFTLSNDKATLSDIGSDSCRVNVGGIVGTHIVTLLVTDVARKRVVIEKEITIIGR